MGKTKRVVFISDFHCGHRVGLTPPKWQYKPTNSSRARFAKMQKSIWNFYTATLKQLQPIDILWVNGDAIDGDGDRSGSTELLEPDRNKQVEMAIECIEVAKAKQILLTRGTPYHGGKEEDFEDHIATAFDAEIDCHLQKRINGLAFDVRHYIGNASLPHTKATPLAKEVMWRMLREDLLEDTEQKIDVFIRSHIHSYNFIGMLERLAITTPAWQGPGSKFGSRLCSGIVDIGCVAFDILNKRSYTWHSHRMHQKFLVQPIQKL